MKIPLILEEELKKIEEKEFIERRIILPATLVGRGLIRTNFIIDTGFPYSFISYSTLLKLNLKRGECIIRKMAIGNVTVNLFTIPSLKFLS
jgi:predicted aspartyl protease